MKFSSLLSVSLAVSLLSSTAAYATGTATASNTNSTSTQTYVSSSTATGWQYKGYKWYYYKSDGSLAKGWLLDKNTWYYFNGDGVMQTGWLQTGGKWYYLKGSGAMATGWIKLGTKWYYMSSSGAMVTGWLNLNGTWYYLTGSGAMATGWLKNNNQWYYLTGSGAMLTGWIKPDGKWYYLAKSGAMKIGWLNIDGTWYYLTGTGAMATGWLTLNNAKYYLAGNGAMQTGWVDLNNNRYYFYPNSGKMATGQVLIDGKPYVFDENGILKPNATVSGWLTDGKNYYYFINNVMQTGWVKIDGKWYYFSSDGTMATGWITVSGKRYFLDREGIMKTGWLFDGKNWFYLNNSGAMHTGWLQLNNKWYYLKENGIMVTGQQTINGKVYFFDASGAWTIGSVVKYVNYDRTFSEALQIQMGLNNPPPQTDKYRYNNAYIQSEYVEINKTNPQKGVIKVADPNVKSVNVYEGKDLKSWVYGNLPVTTKDKSGNVIPTPVDIYENKDGWLRISFGAWRNAKEADVAQYLNPKNVARDSAEFYQFLVLSQPAETNATELNNKVLKGKGILEGKGNVFLEASKLHNINEIYLIAHALLETGNGTSTLAKGIKVSSVDGKPVEPKVVYNMFGIGAIDGQAEKMGAERAYKEGWFSPEKAIHGGAKFISSSYINHATYKQDTLYKMRWNPATPGVHQYATDVGWAAKQTIRQNAIMQAVYDSLDAYTLYFEVPVYK